jgi:RNA polymerase sporulation-specific sigma factor
MFSAVSRASRRQDRTLSDEDWQQEMEKISPEREHGVDPAQQVLQREEEARLFGQIQKWLSAREYQVLMLYLDAYSYEEIAKRLGVSVKTVDNALQRARKKVSAKLIESPQNS